MSDALSTSEPIPQLVRLRPLTPSDVPCLLRETDGGSASAAERVEQEEELRRLVDISPNLVDDGYWALAIEHDRTLVGDIQARAPRNGFPPGVCEIGLQLAVEWRSRGFGTQAVTLFTGYLHAQGWPRVQASTATTNTGMRRVLDRCGYTQEGILRRYAPEGTTGRVDYVLYSSVFDS